MSAFRCSPFVLCVTIVTVCLGPAISCGDELLQNGSFDGALGYWRPMGASPDDNPLVNGHVDLESPDWNFAGDILWQSLNVPVTTGQTVTVSMHLRSSFPQDGQIVAHLDYVTASNEVRRVRLLDHDSDGSNTWSVVGNVISVPLGARKLIRLALHSNYLEADNISLSGPGLVPGPVPMIDGVAIDGSNRTWTAYGSTMVIRGQHLGDSPGTLHLGHSTAGLQVTHWSASQVVAQVSWPSPGGALVLSRDFTDNYGGTSVDVISPHPRLEILGGAPRVPQGVPIDLQLGVTFANGFMPPSGLALSVPEDPGSTTRFTPPIITCSGGSVLRIDTASLVPGAYAWSIEVASPGAAPVIVPLDFNVVAIDRVEFANNDEPGMPMSNPLVVSNQMHHRLGYQLFDSEDHGLSQEGCTVTSDNPAVFEVMGDGPINEQYDAYYSVTNGEARLTLRGPLGNILTNLDVVVTNMRTDRRVVHISLTPRRGSNTGVGTNQFNSVLTGPVSSHTVRNSDHMDQISWNGSAYSGERIFRITEGHIPGSYLHIASVKSGSFGDVLAERAITMDVFNDPSRGMISGQIVFLGEQWFPDGTLHLHHPSNSVTPVASIAVRGFPYVAAYIAPGQYKCRFEHWAYTGDNWYAGARDFAGAETVEVSAGATTPVHFFLSEDPGPPPLDPPMGVMASDEHTGRVQVIWDAVSNAVAYDVWRHTADAIDHDLEHLARVPAPPYDDFSGTPNETYLYWVKAIATNATSMFSSNDTGVALSSTESADLSLAKAATPDPVTLGRDEIRYTIVVSNAGPDAAVDVLIEDPIPEHALLISASGGSYDRHSRTASFDVGVLAAGGTSSVAVVVLPSATGSIVNTASVISSTPDSNTANNTGTAVVVAIEAPDTNGNSMADWWELGTFGNTTNLADGDFDKDGIGNRDEYLMGSDPTASNAPLAIDFIGPTNSMLLTLGTASSRVYRVYAKTNLLDVSWDLLIEQAGDGTVIRLIDDDDLPARYYRIGVAVPGN